MKQKILIVQAIHERGVQMFDDRFEVRVASDPSVATVIKEIRGVRASLSGWPPLRGRSSRQPTPSR